MAGSLETPESGCWDIFTFEDAHWKADPWPWQAVRQTRGRWPMI